MTFRDKYFALPGDMTNATDFWGAMTNCGVASPSGTGTQTCSGDGDGDLESAAASQTGENVLIWQHLANAGLIEGSYTGIVGASSTPRFDIGVNIPPSKLPSAGWGASNRTTTGSGTFYDGNWGNIFQFAAETIDTTNNAGIITPEEAWNIDKKLDDGKPGTGKVMAMHWDDCGGAPDGTTYNTDYALTTTSPECALMFPEAF